MQLNAKEFGASKFLLNIRAVTYFALQILKTLKDSIQFMDKNVHPLYSTTYH